MESALGVWHTIQGRGSVADVQRCLRPDEALISYFMGESQSWMWAITRGSVEAFRLPGHREIVSIATRFRAGIEDGIASDGANVQLYAMLFGSLGANIQAKKDWLLSLDQGLFDVPFAAMGPAHSPLILSHSLRSIFGAGLLGGERVPVASTRFVAAGDAIYNSADPRWRGPRPSNTTQFPRLVNTGPEVMATSRAWTPDQRPTILMGDRFNRGALDEALQADAGVVHIAAHVVRHQTDGNEVMIGLGLGKDGTPDFLTSSDVAMKSLRVGLVALNGCSSGSGAEFPGAGLVGMTRSWLVAGATAVAANYWPVPDDRGDLFQHMYGFIAANRKQGITAQMAARALQSAQVAAWRSSKGQHPRHWAGVFLSTRS
jgi:CHAT domain-containing protein